MSIALILVIMSVTRVAADMGRDVVVSGYLQQFDDQSGVIKTDKGEARIPASSIDRKHVQTGQWATFFVPIEEFVRLNKTKIERRVKTDQKATSK